MGNRSGRRAQQCQHPPYGGVYDPGYPTGGFPYRNAPPSPYYGNRYPPRFPPPRPYY